jgi:NhaP-type Na+/H+ or K+/H+ antiporter
MWSEPSHEGVRRGACSKCLGQVMVLAGPGVVIGMGLLGAFCKIVLPYGWSWNFSLTVRTALTFSDGKVANRNTS